MRTDRIEARVEPERAERIRFAAELEDTSVSSFVMDAAADRAEQVISQHGETVVPADYYQVLLKALDSVTQPVPRLQKAAGRARKLVKRR